MDLDARHKRWTMISHTAEYALRSVVFLGSHVGQPMTTQRIGAATRVPVGYLSKVLQALGKARVVDAQRGVRGGYVLARPIEELTLLDVINAVDPIRRVAAGHPGGAGGEEDGSLAALRRRLDEAVDRLESLFRETTIEQLVAGGGGSSAADGPLALWTGRDLGAEPSVDGVWANRDGTDD